METKIFRGYHRDLANRFVSDLNLPIQNTNEEYFFNNLQLLEDKYSAMTKYRELCDLINEKFDGDPNTFLSEYYQIRDNIITDILESDKYKSFNEMDLSDYAVDRALYNNVTSNNIYNMENSCKTFISIDLKKANFQALRYIGVISEDTYEEFIGKYTDIDYIKNSKYTRQVIFGKLNPKRQITIEKYLISLLYKDIINSDEYKEIGDRLKLVSSSNDELVFEVVGLGEHPHNIFNKIQKALNDRCQYIGFSIQMFKLYALSLWSHNTRNKRQTMYAKVDSFTFKAELMCVPSYYFPLVYASYYNIPLKEFMYHFTFEGMDCRICESFNLVIE